MNDIEDVTVSENEDTIFTFFLMKKSFALTEDIIKVSKM